MNKNSPKYKEAEAILSESMKPVFRKLTEEYEYLTTLHYGRGYVAYRVLADLVLAGWRPSENPDPASNI